MFWSTYCIQQSHASVKQQQFQQLTWANYKITVADHTQEWCKLCCPDFLHTLLSDVVAVVVDMVVVLSACVDKLKRLTASKGNFSLASSHQAACFCITRDPMTLLPVSI